MNPPPFCKTSRLWIPSIGATNAIAHEGAFGFEQWIRIFKQKNPRASDFLIWTPPALILLLWALATFAFEQNDILNSALLILSALYATSMSFFHLVFGWKSRDFFFNKIFQLDFWMGIFFLTFSCEAIWLASPGEWSGTLPPASTLLVPAVGCFIWLQVRSFEAFLWKRRLESHFLEPSFLWPKSGIQGLEVLKYEKTFGFLALLIIAFYLTLSRFEFFPTVHPSLLVLAALPLMIPYFQWQATKLLSQADRIRLVVQNFESFKHLRMTDLVVFHQCGVLTTSEFKTKEFWIAKSEDFTSDEIQDVFLQLSSLTDHPISKLIQKEVEPLPRSLMHLKSHEAKDNLGIIAQFTDLKRRKTSAHLTGLTWHKMHQHEISEEGIEKLRVWKQERVWVTLLSLNRQVVGAIAWSDQARADWRKPPTPAVLITSQPNLLDGFSEDLFDQCIVNSLPLDKDLQRKYWAERADHILECTAPWDRSAGFGIRMLKDREELSDHPLAVLNGSLSAISDSILLSTGYKAFTTATLWLIPLSVILAMTSPIAAILVPPALYLGGLASFARRA